MTVRVQSRDERLCCIFRSNLPVLSGSNPGDDSDWTACTSRWRLPNLSNSTGRFRTCSMALRWGVSSRSHPPSQAPGRAPRPCRPEEHSDGSCHISKLCATAWRPTRPTSSCKLIIPQKAGQNHEVSTEMIWASQGGQGRGGFSQQDLQ